MLQNNTKRKKACLHDLLHTLAPPRKRTACSKNGMGNDTPKHLPGAQTPKSASQCSMSPTQEPPKQCIPTNPMHTLHPSRPIPTSPMFPKSKRMRHQIIVIIIIAIIVIIVTIVIIVIIAIIVIIVTIVIIVIIAIIVIII